MVIPFTEVGKNFLTGGGEGGGSRNEEFSSISDTLLLNIHGDLTHQIGNRILNLEEMSGLERLIWELPAF